MNAKIFILLFLVISACSKSTCKNAIKAEIYDATGTDGCGLVLKIDHEKFVEPSNLNDFDIPKINGTKVWVSYHKGSGGSICMVGDKIVIDCITQR
jgi:hypothetical protein